MRVDKELETLLKQLHLPTFREHYSELAAKAAQEQLSYAEYLVHLCRLEAQVRRYNTIARLVKASRLPLEKTFETFEFNRLPNGITQQVKVLAEGRFVDACENILAFGRPGSGKTHLLCGICHALARQGRRVYFTTCDLMVQQLLRAKQDLELDKLLKRLSRYEVLMIDDFGYVKQNREEMEVLFSLLAYVFLVGPETFHTLARADVYYSEISTLAWGKGSRIIEYGYDANGSLTTKTTTSGTTTIEAVVYTYNLQNRLATATTTPYVGGVAQTATVTAYRYNPDGIRIEKIVDGVSTHYLIDPQNHTGYAQVLTETTGTDVISYVLGDDVLAQAHNASSPQYLLYDGHGSTRQLVAADGSTLVDSYSYDGYGVMLGNSTNPNPAQTAATKLLYSGEQYDRTLSQYYLRARYYNPSNGLFNRVDPYSGNLSDPQSLHKYAYCHNNPVNNIDPSGMMEFSINGVMSAISTLSFMAMNLAIKIAPTIRFVTQVAFATMIASAIQLVLEEARFVPQTGYTKEILAISAMVFTMGLSFSMFIENFRGVVSPVNNSRGQIINANTANQRSGYTSPPYKSGTLATEGKVASSTRLVRVFNPIYKSEQQGRWTMLESDIQGLSPEQIQNKYALSYLPTRRIRNEIT